MPEICFSLPESVGDGPFEHVPIEILDQNFISIGSASPNRGILLTPGLYTARALLPDGRVMAVAFDLTEEDRAEPLRLTEVHPTGPARATPTEGDVAARDALPASFVIGVIGNQPLSGMQFTFDARQVRLRLCHGNPFMGQLEDDAWQIGRAGDHFQIAGRSKPQLVEIEQPGLLMVVPVADGEIRGVEIIEDPERGLLPHFSFGNPDIELALRYCGAKMDAQVQQLAYSAPALAERAFRDPEPRPIASVVGAYALLRAGEMDRLKRWALDLVEENPWLSDAWIVRGEILAREGRHEEAIEAFVTMAETGLPFFSAGLAYAVDRLRQYQAVRQADHGSPLTATPRARALLDPLLHHLMWIATSTDYARPILTFAPPVAPPASPLFGRWTIAGGLGVIGAAALAAYHVVRQHKAEKEPEKSVDEPVNRNIIPG